MPSDLPPNVSFHSAGEEITSQFAQLVEKEVIRRIWSHDATLWLKDAAPTLQNEVTDRLGWLDLPFDRKISTEIAEFANDVWQSDIRSVVLLGMGGSSLAAQTLALTFGAQESRPQLLVLDSTHSEAIQHKSDEVNLAHTLFIVASKSGTTAETLSLFYYFDAAVHTLKKQSGQHFVSISDPGSPLEKMAAEKKFLRHFSSPADVGGRFSALSLFGLLPAGLMGLPVEKLLHTSAQEAESCKRESAIENRAALLGVAMAVLAKMGKNKLTLLTTPKLNPFGSWLEQLVAESTGKDQQGIVPIVGEDIDSLKACSNDRFFVVLRLKNDHSSVFDEQVEAIGRQHPMMILDIADEVEIGALFFAFEFATAVAGYLLSQNPFDQPDVESTKRNTRSLLSTFENSGRLPQETAAFQTPEVDLYGETEMVGGDLPSCLQRFFDLSDAGDYLAFMAYMEPSPHNEFWLQKLRNIIIKNLGLPVTLGFGPRFLHSTGQLHKGGPRQGLFIQITEDSRHHLKVPEKKYDFSTLLAAQSQGDYLALAQGNQRLLRLHLKGESAFSWQAVERAFETCFAKQKHH